MSALIGCAADAVSGLVLYERITVPILPTVRVVPLWWWGLAASPLWLAALCLGWRAASILELAGASLTTALGSHVYIYWASITNRPGFVNQPLAETDPLTFWTKALLVTWLLLVVPFAFGYVARRLANRRWTGHERVQRDARCERSGR